MLTLPHQSNTLFPSKLWLFSQKSKLYHPKLRNCLREMLENMHLRLLRQPPLSVREPLWMGRITPNATSRLHNSNSVRYRIMMQHGSCSAAEGARTTGQPNNSQMAPQWPFQMEILFLDGKIWLQFWLSIIYAYAFHRGKAHFPKQPHLHPPTSNVSKSQFCRQGYWEEKPLMQHSSKSVKN